MEVKVHFRFNRRTGEVETFEIDDVDSGLPWEEHNREHDRIASEIGNLVERNPLIVEGQSRVPSSQPVDPLEAPGDTQITPEQEREGNRR